MINQSREKVSQIKPDPINLKCDWNDDCFTIKKDGAEIQISPIEEEYLVEQLVIKRQPWPGVS